jgi:outer membrane protein assembly factor BamB
MSGGYGTLRENAARAPSVPCQLAAPLREAWSVPIWAVHYTRSPPVLAAAGRLFVADTEGHMRALDPKTQQTLWRSPWRSHGTAFLHDGSLCEWISEEDLHVVDLASGRPSRSIHAPRGAQAIASGGIVVVQRTDHDYGSERLYAFDWRTGRRLWSEGFAEGSDVRGLMSASEELLLYTHCDSNKSPAVETIVARRPDTGALLWSKRDAAISGFAAIRDGRAVVTTYQGVRAFAARDGALLWEAKDVVDGYLYGDRLYARGSGRISYVIVDASSGKLIQSWDLNARLPKALKDRGVGAVLLVSETHVFLGSPNGTLLVFTRDSAEFVWSHTPKQASIRGEAACVDGRLYYENPPFRLTCLEPLG